MTEAQGPVAVELAAMAMALTSHTFSNFSQDSGIKQAYSAVNRMRLPAPHLSQDAALV